MSVLSVGREVMVYNADVAAESAARYAAQHGTGASGAASSALVAVADTPKNASLLTAVKTRLDDAKTTLNWLNDYKKSYTKQSRKSGFNSAFESASTAVKMLRQQHASDVAVVSASDGIYNLGRAATGTFGASHNRSARLAAHVDGLLADIRSGRLNK